MKRCVVGILAALLAVLGTRGAQAENEGVRQELQAHYNRVARGWKDKDVRSVMAPLASDFTHVMPDGTTTNRRQNEASVQKILATLRTVKEASSRIDELSVSGNDATVAVTTRMSGVSVDPQEKEHRFSYRDTYRDSWRRAAAGWELVTSVRQKAELKLDGKQADSANPLGAAPSGAASEVQDANVEQTLRQIEREMTDALLKGDGNAIGRHLADDYLVIQGDGQVQDKARFMADLNSGDVKVESSQLDQMKVRVYGETAVVTFRSTDKLTVKGKDISGQVRWTDVFVRRGGRWQMVSTQGTPIRQK